MLDEVDLVTGVSGGSFTALAYGLYGDKLFDIYEASFLKRDVQGELIARALNPGNWGALSSETLGPLRAGGAVLRRDTLPRCHLRRSGSRHRPPNSRERHRHLDRRPAGLHAIRLRLPLLGPERGTAFPRSGCIVGRALRTLAGDAQQLWRQLQVRYRRSGSKHSATPGCSATGRPCPQDTRGPAGVPGWRPSAVHPSRGWSAWPTTLACAPCSRYWRPSRL